MKVAVNATKNQGGLSTVHGNKVLGCSPLNCSPCSKQCCPMRSACVQHVCILQTMQIAAPSAFTSVALSDRSTVCMP